MKFCNIFVLCLSALLAVAGCASTKVTSRDEAEVDKIISLVQNLPSTYRTVFSMYVVDGYSHAEIAKEC